MKAPSGARPLATSASSVVAPDRESELDYPGWRVSLADAVSFEVMRTRRIRRALALDERFVLAGFELAR